MKKEIAQLKSSILDAKKSKDIDLNVYQLKSQYNALKAKRLFLKQTMKKNPKTKPIIEREDIKRKAVDSNAFCFQWLFDDGKISGLCSNLNGDCKRCNQSNLNTVYIQNHEERISLCLNCIRALFDEMKPSKEDYENQLATLKFHAQNEEKCFQDIHGKRQEEIARIESMVASM
jgi:hypothetical protein